MGFASASGYTPLTIEEIISQLRVELNTQFSTTYTEENFIGTNWYKFLYAAAQKMQLNEVKTSEIFTYLQNYIATTNERISRPSNTPPGILEQLEDEGWTASVKPPEVGDAGKLYVCVQLDDADPDYADTQLAVNTKLSTIVAAGIVTQGTETDAIVLSNGQSFDFKFNLPTEIDPLLKLTTVLSENNQVVIPSPEDQKSTLMANIAANYKLGKNFEPERYFTLADAPWASSVLLEYKIGMGAYTSAVYDADYDELFVIDLENIELVET